MFSILGGTINALIDSLFVSLKLGSNGLSAVNLCMPVYLTLCIFGSAVGFGASFLSANSVGRDRMEEAGKYYHTALLLCLIMGICFIPVGLFLGNPLSLALSQGSTLRFFVSDYCKTLLFGSLPFLLSYTFINYLQLEGKTKGISAMVIIMVACDTVLDLLLLFVFDLGMTGAALASVLSTAAAVIAGFFCLQRGTTNYRFELRKVRFFQIGRILRFGSPAALGNLYDAARLLIINMYVLYFEGTEAVAVWAALNTLTELSLVIVQGVPRTGAPMIGVYSAARENSGIRTLFGLQIRTGLICSLIYAFLTVAIHEPIRVAFSLSTPMFLPLVCLGISLMINTLGAVFDSYYNAVGRIWLSNLLVAFRRLIFPIAGIAEVYFFRISFWYSLPIGMLVLLVNGFLIIKFTAVLLNKKGRGLSGILLLCDNLERENKVLDFSIGADMEEVCSASEQIKDFCSKNNISARLTMSLGLSIEELLNVMIQKNPEIRYVDLRAFVLDEDVGIRIRTSGKKYNPFEDKESSEDFLLGVNMLKKMCSIAKHSYTLGMNTINIKFPAEQKNE